MIDFLSSQTEVLLNPRLPEERRLRMEEAAREVGLAGHVWLSTSGTGGSARLIALSKHALLASAESVNARLCATVSDTWCCVLPTFHVGGLGIHARALLTRSRVVERPWDPRGFAEDCRVEGVTLTSLVPAQVVDLVTAGLRSPEALRAVVVGGGSLPDGQRQRALELGWPVLPSYGMTECSSQIATAESGDDPALILLSHVDVETRDGFLAVRSPALLTGLLEDAEAAGSFRDPKFEGWFLTADRGTVEGRRLTVVGRGADFVKIGGESVNLADLERVLAGLSSRSALVAVPDDRLGSVIHLVTEESDADRLLQRFNEQVLPFERIREVHPVDAIPRSPLGKVLRGTLLEVAKKKQKGQE